jgi:hypothetical protein
MTKPYITKSLICSPDGTVTYWSTSQQEWVCKTRSIPENDLLAMSPSDRRRALLHLTHDNFDVADQA